MRQNALLRSAKGLEAPGPTRKKVAPVAVVASAPVEEREDHFAIRNGVRCAGVHLIVDLHGAQGLNDIDLIEATLRRCVDAARRDAAAHPSAPFLAERRVRRGGAGGEPHLDPHLAGRRLCGARRVHVRPGRFPTPAFRSCARRSRPSASRSTRSCAGETPEQAQTIVLNSSWPGLSRPSTSCTPIGVRPGLGRA